MRKLELMKYSIRILALVVCMREWGVWNVRCVGEVMGWIRWIRWWELWRRCWM